MLLIVVLSEIWQSLFPFTSSKAEIWYKSSKKFSGLSLPLTRSLLKYQDTAAGGYEATWEERG